MQDGISGATAMIDDGAMEGVDHVIALHIISHLEVRGLPIYRMVLVMRPSTALKHGCVETVVMVHIPTSGRTLSLCSVRFYQILYAIPSRMINPMEQCVISLG